MLSFAWIMSAVCLPLPLVARWLLPAASVTKEAALRIPFLNDFKSSQASGNIVLRQPVYGLILTVVWIALVLAAMRPQWLGEIIELPISGRDLMLAVDLSGSMEMEDFNIKGKVVDRLSATKYVASKFINGRVGDRIGLILFGSQAYLQTPLTFDRDTVNQFLDEAVIGLAGKKTAIGDAIGLAIKRLGDEDIDSRVLILLTDGNNTAGEVSPLKAAELAAIKKLKIYTIGIGADSMQVRSLFGSRTVNPSSDLDEKTLTKIATLTGGQYFRARNTNALQKIYEKLDELEPIEKETQSFRPMKELYIWPLGFAFILASLLVVLQNWRWTSNG